MKGKFISVEGSDGSGKSTNVPILVQALRNKGYTVHHTREPGGTTVGEKIRTILLNDHMWPMTELLLFAAQRAEHIDAVIKPAIDRGEIIVSDRFFDSTYAYQGARGFDKEVVQIEEFVHKGFKPDYTVYFDVTLEESFARILKRSSIQEMDRFENEEIEYRTKVYRGYKKRFLENPDRMVRIDGMLSPNDVSDQVLNWVNSIF